MMHRSILYFIVSILSCVLISKVVIADVSYTRDIRTQAIDFYEDLFAPPSVESIMSGNTDVPPPPSQDISNSSGNNVEPPSTNNNPNSNLRYY